MATTRKTSAPAESTPSEVPEDRQLGVGLDIGTMNIVAARHGASGVGTKRIRDAFVDFPLDAQKMLKLSNVPFVKRQNELLILGDHAFATANTFGKEARRPLSGGLVSASEIDALEVLALLIKNVLGAPTVPGEHCYFSIPAAPVDQPGRSVVYHEGVFTRIVSECGYTPHSANEAMAIIFSDAASDQFSGISLSFGSGMTNVAMALNTMQVLTFSVAMGGDYIDGQSAQAVGSTASKMTVVKESGLNLMVPKTREQEALVFYYRNLIRQVLEHFVAEFRKHQAKVTLPGPIPIIVSGGTSKPEGFLDLFRQEFATFRFPFEISEIRAAADPLNAVALGLMLQASQEYETDEEE